MRTIIVDDEFSCRKTISNNLTKYCKDVDIINEANSVNSAFEIINKYTPDLVFLDVEMQDGTAFDLLRKFSKVFFNIIFVTAHDKYAIKAFKYSTIDYLLKPVEPDLLVKAVEKNRLEKRLSEFESKIDILLQNQKQFNKIALPTFDGCNFVKVTDIIRVEAENNYANFYLNTGQKIMVCKPLKEYDTLLPDSLFFRSHKSHLINLEYVKQFVNRDGGCIIMEDNSSVAVSRRKKDDFFKAMKM